MICGDDPYKFIFPYRSSSDLTDFFQEIDLDYSHDRVTTRRYWVRDVLKSLNDKDNQINPILPSPEIIKVIEALINSVEPSSPNFSKTLDLLNDLLKPENFSIKINESTNNGKLILSKGNLISTASDPQQITKYFTFCPNVFEYPKNDALDYRLVSVMMPFSKEFDEVHKTIQKSCKNVELYSRRVDNIWDNSVIIQDIFDLICKSAIVIADFSKKNSNVFYEVGIAHTLGKDVIPIVQNIEDIPFDLKHHRVLQYHDNGEGRMDLQKGLESRLKTLKEKIRKNHVKPQL